MFPPQISSPQDRAGNQPINRRYLHMTDQIFHYYSHSEPFDTAYNVSLFWKKYLFYIRTQTVYLHLTPVWKAFKGMLWPMFYIDINTHIDRKWKVM